MRIYGEAVFALSCVVMALLLLSSGTPPWLIRFRWLMDFRTMVGFERAIG